MDTSSPSPPTTPDTSISTPARGRPSGSRPIPSAIAPRSSISDRRPLAGFVVGLLLATSVAEAGRRNRRREPPPPAPPPPPAEEPPPPPPRLDVLFPPDLPLDPGPTPDGLANVSAQGCAACHVRAHARWALGAHADGTPTPDFVEAADAAGPACWSCHLPLAQQHPATHVYDQDDPARPLTRHNGHVDLTLRAEGVTCAACHVRDGAIVATAYTADTPHPLVVSDTLGRSEGCAACHQLTWDGAEEPLYDTFGEWSRSPYAAAGIGCLDCHYAAAVDGGGDHAMSARSGTGLSVTVRADRLALTRGGEPLDVEIVLQNTGAGHHLPTGSPFTSWVLDAFLEGPPPRRSQTPTRAAGLEVVLGRALEEGPPWRTVSDTRLAAFEERTIQWAPQLTLEDPPGDWHLVVDLVERVHGKRPPTPIRRWRVPLAVD